MTGREGYARGGKGGHDLRIIGLRTLRHKSALFNSIYILIFLLVGRERGAQGCSVELLKPKTLG